MQIANGMSIDVGIVQLHAVPGERDRNLAVAAEHLRAMAADGLDLAVLPELFSSGYDLEADLEVLAEDLGGPTVTLLAELAGQLDIVVATSILARSDNDDLMNRAVIIDASGVRAWADKSRLWGNEWIRFGAGTGDLASAETSKGTVGVAICYEAGFPESARALAQRGVDVIAVPSAFGRQRLHAWDVLTRSRALENGCFVVAAGMCGENESGAQFAATSRIVDPRGQVLAELGAEPGHAVRRIDLADIERARAEIPYLTDLAADSSTPVVLS